MLWCSPLLAAVLTLGCGSLLFIALGHDPLLTFHTLLIAPISDLYGVSELLVKALPILLCALGLAVAYQAPIWNIGAEGRLLLGALAGSALAVNIIGMQSRWALVLILLAGTLAGAAWAGLTAWLRTRFNANEILTSIMLNYIALNLLLFCVHGPLKDPAGFNFPESAMFGDASRLPLLMEDGEYIRACISPCSRWWRCGCCCRKALSGSRSKCSGWTSVRRVLSGFARNG